jgi:hypothetical protein
VFGGLSFLKNDCARWVKFPFGGFHDLIGKGHTRSEEKICLLNIHFDTSRLNTARSFRHVMRTKSANGDGGSRRFNPTKVLILAPDCNVCVGLKRNKRTGCAG